MTPKQKAIELIDKFFLKAVKTKEQSKQCAIISVDEIIASIPTQPSTKEAERIDATFFWIDV